jgi:hypothetical protein
MRPTSIPGAASPLEGFTTSLVQQRLDQGEFFQGGY